MPDFVVVQYGAIGSIAMLALLAVRVLFKREIDAHQRDIDRANRTEEELSKLNDAIRQQYLTVLVQATSAITDTLAIIGEIRRYDNRRKGR